MKKLTHGVKRQRVDDEVVELNNRHRPTANPGVTAPTAGNLFTWMLGVSRVQFFKRYFEKEHLVCSHGSAAYFSEGRKGIAPPMEWSTSRMTQLATERELHFGTDVNIVRFDKKLGQRVSYQTHGILSPHELKNCMKSGWSVRFLRPHEFIECNSAFISCMEAEFGCYCGVNSYWTPADSQGFAPHYDDVDVFLFQLEGQKEWRLYDPLEDVDYLTRHSSEDYLPEQFPIPKHSITLKAGDVLYMPRGMVHQGRTPAHTHSLHITFSANQMNSWADLFLRATTHSIETLAANHMHWRRAVPKEFFDVMGEMNSGAFREEAALAALSEKAAGRRTAFQEKFRKLVTEVSQLLADEGNMDRCTDMYAKDIVYKLQPLSDRYHHLIPRDKALTLATEVRLASKNCCRLLLHVGGEAHLVHNGENSSVCLSGGRGDLAFEADFAPALATLISCYPKTVKVSALPFPGFEDPEDVAENQLVLCEALRDAGILRGAA